MRRQAGTCPLPPTKWGPLEGFLAHPRALTPISGPERPLPSLYYPLLGVRRLLLPGLENPPPLGIKDPFYARKYPFYARGDRRTTRRVLEGLNPVLKRPFLGLRGTPRTEVDHATRKRSISGLRGPKSVVRQFHAWESPFNVECCFCLRVDLNNPKWELL